VGQLEMFARKITLRSNCGTYVKRQPNRQGLAFRTRVMPL
jgi:hypothetical protein